MEEMLKYPNLRVELIETLRGLSDTDYQNRVWIQGVAPVDYEDDFNHVTEFFYDDTVLAHDIKSTVSEILIDDSEVQPVQRVINAISHLRYIYGKKLSDEEYLSKPEWSFIVEEARIAYEVLKSKEIDSEMK